MNNEIKKTVKNCLAILIMALLAMMFYAVNLNAQPSTVTTLTVKAAIEGLYNINNGYMSKDADVTVYLRNSEQPFKIVSSAKGTINKMTLEGVFEFYNITAGQYYIVLKSGNTIETWSRKGGEFFGISSETSYDFTSGKEKAFGDNLILDNNSKHARIFTGDVNQDGFVNAKDLEQIEKNLINKTILDMPEDLNGDYIVNNTDYKIAYKNTMQQIQSVTPIGVFENSDAFPSAVVRIKALVEGLCNFTPATIGMTADPYITVELRNTDPPYEMAASASGYVNKKSLEGYFTFLRLIPGKYYIVLKSKNTVETWSRKGEEILFGKLNYDFTAGKEVAFGENMHECGNYSCLFSGDVNQDGYVDETDLKTVLGDFDKKGSLATDLNGDELVDKLDYEIVNTNFEKKITSITPSKAVSSNIVIEIKAAFEGLINFDPDKGYFSKDAMVNVYLREVNDPYNVVCAAKGYINGSTLSGTFNFPNVSTGEYYIILQSRNTIETWSTKGGQTITAGEKFIYDFTAGKDMAYGDNMFLLGKYACIYTGDIDQNGFVDKYDVDAVFKDVGKTIKGESVTDLNGDQVVDNLDYEIVVKNYKEKVMSIRPVIYQKPIGNAVTESFTLKQNSPNPFNPSTNISLNLQNTSDVKLSIYDMSGRAVEVLVNTVLNPGNYVFKWNAGNYASGTYFYRLNVNGEERTMKMQLIK